jgi:hypothetical protein
MVDLANDVNFQTQTVNLVTVQARFVDEFCSNFLSRLLVLAVTDNAKAAFAQFVAHVVVF